MFFFYKESAFFHKNKICFGPNDFDVLRWCGSDSMDSFKFKKKYGQNFLQNKGIIKKIAECGDVENKSLIIEVGPGSGNLTEELALLYSDSNILAYEVDDSLEKTLLFRLHKYPNVKVLFGDFLKADLDLDIKDYNYNKLYFISNVPYYITTPILFKLITSNLVFTKIVMMVQKEVGDRFCSEVSKKSYGALTVILNYYFEVKKEFKVDRNQFFPRPNVDSIVVSFKRKENLLPLKNVEFFFELVHDSFRYKRKMLRNNLKKYNLEIIEKVLLKYNFDLTVRAEELDYYIYVDMANSLC